MKKFLPSSLRYGVNPNKGFTLVELMVVISIIALLSVIGITIFTGIQKSGRDAKRRSDIQAISKAYESVYVNKAPRYRILAGSTDFSGGNVPVDPSTGAPYEGILSTAKDTYTVCALLEKADGNAKDAIGTVATGAEATYYCQKNQQ